MSVTMRFPSSTAASLRALSRASRAPILRRNLAVPSATTPTSTASSSQGDSIASSSTPPLSPPHSTSSPVSPSASTPSPSTKATAPPRLAWTITRTDNRELPVYSKSHNGGGWKTIIRKVTGDVHACQRELAEYLAKSIIDPFAKVPTVTVRPTNRHVEIRGKWVREVKEWFESKGF